MDTNDPMETPAEVREDVPALDADLMAAMKRLVYGVESIMSTIPEAWTDERDEILRDIEEVRERWPNQDL